MQRHCRFIVSLLTIGLSLWNPTCLAQDNVATSQGSCSADNPETCGNLATGINLKEAEDSDCQDEDSHCASWADHGECDNNPNYMLKHCPRSCLQCTDQAEELQRKLDKEKKKIRTWTNTELEFGEDMGVKQNLENVDFSVSREESTARITASREHIRNGNIGQDVIEICKNQHEDCTTW